jgi:hypothetical protein
MKNNLGHTSPENDNKLLLNEDQSSFRQRVRNHISEKVSPENDQNLMQRD